MAVEMKSHQFRREREDTWKQLEYLTTKAEKKGIKSLDADEITRLPQLYRATLSSLSVARAISLDQNVLTYLEGLATRAHLVLYGNHERAYEAFSQFFAHRLPRAIRAMGWELALATLTLLLGALAGFFLTMMDPDWFYAFVNSEIAQGRTPTTSTEELREVIDGSKSNGVAGLDLFTTFLVTHNAQVGITAFALGIAFGLPTLYLLFSTGTMLGGFLALYASRDLGVELGGWLMIHGTTELFAVIVCGAAGLHIGRAMVFPGKRLRMENLATAGRTAAMAVMGGVFMFVIAGFLEGFGRQLIIDTVTRYTIATVMLVLWCSYFYLAGHKKENDAQSIQAR